MPLVDLDDPEELRARWSALAAVSHATGFDRRWYADMGGYYHQDETGSILRLQRLGDGRAVLFGYQTQHSQTAGSDLLAGSPEWIGQPEVRQRLAAGELGFVYGAFNGTWARAAYEGDPWEPVPDGFLEIGGWITSEEDSAREMIEWVAEWADYLGGLDSLLPAGIALIRTGGAITPEALGAFFAAFTIDPRSPVQPNIPVGVAAAREFSANLAVAEKFPSEPDAPVGSVVEPVVTGARDDGRAGYDEESFVVPPGISPFTGQPIATDTGGIPLESGQPAAYQQVPFGRDEKSDEYGVVGKKQGWLRRRKQDEPSTPAAAPPAAPAPGSYVPTDVPDNGLPYNRLPSSEPPRVGGGRHEGDDFYASLFADTPATPTTPDPDWETAEQPAWSDADATSEYNPFQDAQPNDATAERPPITPEQPAPHSPFAPGPDATAPHSPFAPVSDSDVTADHSPVARASDQGAAAGHPPSAPAADPQATAAYSPFAPVHDSDVTADHSPVARASDRGAAAGHPPAAPAADPQVAAGPGQANEGWGGPAWVNGQWVEAPPSSSASAPSTTNAPAAPSPAQPTASDGSSPEVGTPAAAFADDDDAPTAEIAAVPADDEASFTGPSPFAPAVADPVASPELAGGTSDRAEPTTGNPFAPHQGESTRQAANPVVPAANAGAVDASPFAPQSAEPPRTSADQFPPSPARAGEPDAGSPFGRQSAGVGESSGSPFAPGAGAEPDAVLDDETAEIPVIVEASTDQYPQAQVEPHPQPWPQPTPGPWPQPTDPQPVPTPHPSPDPRPAPGPDPYPAPGPDPLPTPEPQPDPYPHPTPEPTPTPDPTPRPGPDPTPYPDPEPSPFPVPDPTPYPAPDPTPYPTPEPNPYPGPDPTPYPGPDPTPYPGPDPTPYPTPEPMPQPEPEPVPQPVPPGEPEPVPDPVPAPEPGPEPVPEPREPSPWPDGQPGQVASVVGDDEPTGEIPVVDAAAAMQEPAEDEWERAGASDALTREPEAHAQYDEPEVHAQNGHAPYGEPIAEAWSEDAHVQGGEPVAGAWPQNGHVPDGEPVAEAWSDSGRAQDGEAGGDGWSANEYAQGGGPDEEWAEDEPTGVIPAVFDDEPQTAYAQAGRDDGEAQSAYAEADRDGEPQAGFAEAGSGVGAPQEGYAEAGRGEAGLGTPAGLGALASAGGMSIPGLGLVGADGPGVELVPGSLEEAMRAERERSRPRPKGSPAFDALHAWCRARTAIVPSGFTIQVQVLDPGAPSYRFDLEPPEVDDPEFAADKLSELLGDLWVTEAQGEHGGWLFARLDAAGRTLRIDRWYDQVPEWWDTPVESRLDVGNLARRLTARAPQWQPSYVEKLYTSAR
ncbi:hypothetical protein GCM10009745_56720 [Kribbella yunnanensis]|uniref:Uncharacterized protein n=1 Tax=Kribbella yunnanensis TaxID=190194 RepID=A0ABN2IC34_9ACTN